MFQEASAYKDQVIAKATGEAERFEALLVEYSKAPEVTRERLYLDAISEVYSNSSKVLIDVEGGNNMMYLPLDKIVSDRSAGSVTSMRSDASSSDISDLADRVIEEIRARNARTGREVR